MLRTFDQQTNADVLSRDPIPLVASAKPFSELLTYNNPLWFPVTTFNQYDTTIVSTEDAVPASVPIPFQSMLGL